MKLLSTMAALLATTMLAAQNDLVLDIVTDRYGDETTWELRDAQGNALFTGGPYDLQLAQGAYPQTPVTMDELPDGTYTFIIFDEYQDGMCCTYGQGSYTLTHTGLGVVVANGGVFQDVEETTFDLPPPPPPPASITPLQLELTPFASGFNRLTDISHAGDERLFVVERGGVIKIVDPQGNIAPEPFLDITASVLSGSSLFSEQGLFSVAFHPQYADNGYFFVNYTAPGIGPAGHSRVSRFTVSGDPDVADADSEVILYTVGQPYGNHNGGDMEFGPDGYLYVSLGDGGSGGDPENYAQTHSSALGTMLRLDVDVEEGWAVPADNPFINNGDTLPEIWATGLRNAWRFSFDDLTGDMYIADVGQSAWEEVNFIPAGEGAGWNFGWRCYEGNAPFNLNGCLDAENYVFPVTVHSNGPWCSVTGGRVYRGSEYPRLQGWYIYTDFCLGQFHGLQQVDGEWENPVLLAQGVVNATTFGTNAELDLFVGTITGEIHRIGDICTADAPSLALEGSILLASAGESYAWLLDGEFISGATEAILEPVANGTYQVIVEVNEGCFLASPELEVTNVGLAEWTTTPIRVWPNPADTRFFLEGPLEGVRLAELVDLSGRSIMRASLEPMDDRATLEVGDIAAGTYVLVLRDRSGAQRASTQLTISR